MVKVCSGQQVVYKRFIMIDFVIMKSLLELIGVVRRHQSGECGKLGGPQQIVLRGFSDLRSPFYGNNAALSHLIIFPLLTESLKNVYVLGRIYFLCFICLVIPHNFFKIVYHMTLPIEARLRIAELGKGFDGKIAIFFDDDVDGDLFEDFDGAAVFVGGKDVDELEMRAEGLIDLLKLELNLELLTLKVGG